MTSLQEFVLEALKSQGFEGLCDGECGCGIDDPFPCGDGPFSDCAPAICLVVPDDGIVIDPQDGQLISHEGQPGDTIFIFAQPKLGSAK